MVPVLPYLGTKILKKKTVILYLVAAEAIFQAFNGIRSVVLFPYSISATLV